MENPNLAVGGNGGAGEADNSQKKSLLDKLTNLGGTPKSEEPIDYSKLKNVKTKSMVASRHETASEELRQLQILEEQRQAQLRMQEKVVAAKKTSVYLIVTAICIVLLICLVFFFISLAKYLRKPNNADIGGGAGGTSEVIKLGTYACKKDDCVAVQELSDGRQLIIDSGYLLYDQGKEESFVLSLEGDYESFTEFTWGDNQYLLAKDADNLGAIFSITENKYITDAIYEDVLGDQFDPAYKDMNWVVGKLIIAKRSGSYRLVDIDDGSEKVSGVLGVFATKSGYYISREEDGVLRVFNSSKKQILLTNSGDQLYERDGLLIVANADRFELYNNDGAAVRTDDCSFYNELHEKERGELVGFLNNNAAYLHIQ